MPVRSGPFPLASGGACLQTIRRGEPGGKLASLGRDWGLVFAPIRPYALRASLPAGGEPHPSARRKNEGIRGNRESSPRKEERRDGNVGLEPTTEVGPIALPCGCSFDLRRTVLLRARAGPLVPRTHRHHAKAGWILLIHQPRRPPSCLPGWSEPTRYRIFWGWDRWGHRPPALETLGHEIGGRWCGPGFLWAAGKDAFPLPSRFLPSNAEAASVPRLQNRPRNRSIVTPTPFTANVALSRSA